MASILQTHLDLSPGGDAGALREALGHARRAYYEEPADAMALAIRCHEAARSLGDDGLCARARALQGAVSLHRGDLRSALDLVVEAERHAQDSGDAEARAEVAALRAQVSFFTGSYAEALSHAELAVQLADEMGDDEIRIYARRATCLVFGNVGVRDLEHRVRALLGLTLDVGDRWEETISRNDLACFLQQTGDLAGAEAEIARALDVAHEIGAANRFALGLVHSTRADIGLMAGRPADALADAERAIALLTAGGEANPYVLGVTVRAEVQARMALGQFDDAQQSGEGALAWLGDRVPQIRSLILSTLATELRAAGHVEAAYDALARSAELEREAFRELSELQLSLERATLEATTARRAGDALAAKNRELAQAHAELILRTRQLESLQEQLRDHVLIRVAGLLCDVLRETDIVIRSGGEEFLVLMPATDARAGAAGCERIRGAIAGEEWETIASGLAVTASVGVACTQEPGDLEGLVRVADQRLYEAKRAGRNRVVS